MRLDCFLWFARIVRKREWAREMALAGRLRIDGRAVDRAHAAVRVGQVLTLMQGEHVRALRIEALPARRGSAPEARECYTDLLPVANTSQSRAAD